MAKDKHKLKCVQFLKGWIEQLNQFIDAAEDGNEQEVERIIKEINNEYPLRYLKDKVRFFVVAMHAGSTALSRRMAAMRCTKLQGQDI